MRARFAPATTPPSVHPRAAAVALVLLATAAAPLPAQETGDRKGGLEARKTLEAAPREGPVRIDGRLAEEAWERAPVGRGFVQGQPTEGAEPVEPTEVRVLYDQEALYVGARMYESDPSRITDQLVRRDEEGQFDFISIGLDPNLDQQTGYIFRVGVSGVEWDGFISEGTGGFDQGPVEVNWNAVWESGVHVDSAGWTAEMRIPLSQIRFESKPGAQRWGVNFRRRRVRSNSFSHFTLMSQTVEGFMSEFGLLTNLRFQHAGRRFEVEPYVVSELRSRPVAAGNPLLSETEFSPRAGLDLSYGVGSNFTLDATVNPDFGQVEVDPAVINLTAFETFFPEKRPFFVQDAQIFGFRTSGRRSRLFFSRRIGRDPHGRATGGSDFARVPDRTTILGASKFTGRTTGGLSVGALAAVTAEETGTAYFADVDSTGTFVVEPLSEYAVGRVQQDFRDGNTRVGAILTGVNRHLPASGRLDDLPTEAFSGGLDFTHRWGGPNDRRWAVQGYYAASHVRGSRRAMLDIQTNPQHYFQRPDARRLEVDSTATSLTGSNWRLSFGRRSAEHWTWDVWLAEITPEFAANDIGFNKESHRLDGGARIQFREVDPGPLFRSWQVGAFMFHNWRHTLLDDFFSADQWAQSYKDGFVNADARFEFHNNWSVQPRLGYRPQALSGTETRGGPLMVEPAARVLGLRVGTDPTESVVLEPNVEYRDRELGAGHRLEAGLELTLRPAPSWQVQLEPKVRDEADAAQYVATAGNQDYVPTFGDRYIFADLERVQISMDTRLNLAFSPDLSLQLFAQPLLSAVNFVTFKQLARPESFDFDRFAEGEADEGALGVRCLLGRTCTKDGTRYIDFDGDTRADFSFPRPDFNFRSLRGNAVVRWEFQPGSILFLVWQHDRRERADLGSFDFGRDLNALFDTDSENTFIVKASYFLDL